MVPRGTFARRCRATARMRAVSDDSATVSSAPSSEMKVKRGSRVLSSAEPPSG